MLRLVAKGLSNREIAEQLVVTEATVRSHVSNTLSKLHLANRVQATLYALQEGLASLENREEARLTTLGQLPQIGALYVLYVCTSADPVPQMRTRPPWGGLFLWTINSTIPPMTTRAQSGTIVVALGQIIGQKSRNKTVRTFECKEASEWTSLQMQE